MLELADGSRYEGGFKADQPDGYGLYQGADGSRYQGELSAGMPQGEGFEVTADGAAYHGGFSAGERHGQGTLLFADGGIYEGGFENGKANGKGVLPTSPVPPRRAPGSPARQTASLSLPRATAPWNIRSGATINRSPDSGKGGGK